MGPYDLLMLIVLAGAIVFGFARGIVWQLAAIAAYVASYFVSLRFSDRLAPYFGQQAPLNRFIAMAVIYAGTSAAIWIAFRFVKKTIDTVHLGSFDRQLGAILGAGKGVVLCVIVTFFAVSLSEPSRKAVLESRSGHYIAELIRRADPIMPPEIHDILDPYLDRLEKQLEPTYSNDRIGRNTNSSDDVPAPQLNFFRQ